jgi:AraC-like DNA-binding protein
VEQPARPYPGSRIVDRVAAGQQVQPWPSNNVRYIARSWRGPVHIQAEGVDFNIRYVAAHEHVDQGQYPLHTHPYAELLLTLEGEGELADPGVGRVLACRPGTAVVMTPQRIHQSRWQLKRGVWRMLVIDFDLGVELGLLPMEDGEQVDLAFAPFYEWFFIRQEPQWNLSEAARPVVLERGAEIIGGLAPGAYGVCSEVVAGVLRLIALLSRDLKGQAAADGRHIVPAHFSRETALLKARTLMEHRGMFDPGCVQRIARTVGMSESHFIRAFRAAYGLTPKKYSQRVLMRRACGLLEGTDLPVRAVADRLGYEDAATFSRAFKGMVGASPEAYRRESTGRRRA